VVTQDAARSESRIRQRLDTLGIIPYTIEQTLPNMEDVFISLIEADDRNDPADIAAHNPMDKAVDKPGKGRP
jgi:hypothetical protein